MSLEDLTTPFSFVVVLSQARDRQEAMDTVAGDVGGGGSGTGCGVVVGGMQVRMRHVLA
jgi:hypothetical protein